MGFFIKIRKPGYGGEFHGEFDGTNQIHEENPWKARKIPKVDLFS